MHKLHRRALLAGAAAALAAPHVHAQARIPVTFGTNWIAQAEHGGFYQAVADGTYARLGLDVTIVPGGPQVNNRALMAAGRIDFFMGGSLIQPFAAIENNVPTLVVAALFQKEPQALLTHPGRGLDRFEDLKRIPLLIARTGETTFYRWLIAEHGFKPEQVRPYTFNSGPFCADPGIGQQAYVTAEPFAIRRACGFDPNVFLLADHGYDTLSTTIECTRATLDTRANVVKAFVEGSILGWYAYLYRDGAPANRLIRAANPDMSEEQIAWSTAAMKRYGIVDSGDAETLGIGAVTEARVKSFFDRMVRAGVTKADTDWRRAFDARFVNQRLGIELRP